MQSDESSMTIVDGDFLEVCKDPLSVTIGKEFLKRFSNSKIVINGDDLTIKHIS